MVATLEHRRTEPVEAQAYASPLSCTYSDTLVTVEVHTPDPGEAHKNQYVACANNPVNYRDPLGLCDSSKKKQTSSTKTPGNSRTRSTKTPGLQGHVVYGNNPVNCRDPLGLCSEDSGYWSRVRRHYGAELESHGSVLEWADTLGLWGLGAVGVNAVGVNAVAGGGQGLANYMAGEQIANSMLAGANTGGSMWARQAAASQGARTAARTAAGRAALSGVGKVTLGATVFNTSYSISARIISGGRALIYGIWE